MPFVPKSYAFGNFYLNSPCLGLAHLQNGIIVSTAGCGLNEMGYRKQRLQHTTKEKGGPG